MHRKITSMMLLMLLLAGTASAQTSNSLSLDQALQYASENAPLLSNARLDVEIARKKVYETTAIGLPQIAGQLSFQNFIDIPTQVIPANAFNPQAPADEMMAVQFGTEYNTSASVTANQLVFDGSYIVGLQAARTYKELSAQNLVRTESEVREQVKQAYYTAVIMQENLEILEASLENVQALREEMQAIYEAGMTEEQDVEQLMLTESSIRNMLLRTSRQTDLARDLLKINIGMPISENISLTDDAETLLSKAQNLPADTTFSPSSHYDYRLAATNSELMKLNLRKERYAYLPSIGAFLSYQQNAFRNEFDVFSNKPWYPTTMWGFNLQLPIFDSGMKAARVSQAKFEHQKSLNLLRLTENQLRLQASARRADLETAAERMENEKANQELARKIFDKTLIKYREGLASSLELNQAQTQLLNTQSAYINTILEVLNARAAYLRATGN